jgi:hypothetical protein
MTLHSIRLAPAGRDFAITAADGPIVARTLPDAARELLDSGRAKWGDKARVTHPEHTPFTIDLARVVAYRPSAQRREIEGKRFTFMPRNDI